MSDDLTIAYMLGVEDMRSKLHKQADQIERLRAENEKLREALKPFAEKYTVKDDNLPNEHNALTLINVGDLRAARKALGETDD
jgi:hypothetical protein